MSLGLGTGFCGSLTTFSALTVDVAQMARDSDWGYAAGYLAVSVLGGVALAVGRGHPAENPVEGAQ